MLLPGQRRWSWHARLLARLGEANELVAGADSAELVVDLTEGGSVPDDLPVLRPLYDGAPDSRALVARLQHKQCPYLSIVDRDGVPLLASYAAIEDKAVAPALDMAFARVEALLLRAVAGQAGALAPAPERPLARFDPFFFAKAAARRRLGKLLAPLRRRRGARPGHWNIALRPAAPIDLAGFALADWTPLPPDREVFYADPFLFEADGKVWLFAEACPYATGKGVIACAQLAPDGEKGPWRTVLEEPWHLSYPYVFRAGGETWLVPESSADGGIDLYRAEQFPDRWVRERRLFEDLRLVDATLFEHEGRVWLLAGGIAEGGSSWDELFAWHAPDLAGPWTPHRLSPIKSDCRGARPGGRPLRLDGRLLRPAQVCETRYGESLAWMEVKTLTPDAFEEVEVARWQAGAGASGPHSADLGGPVHAVDFRSDLPREG